MHNHQLALARALHHLQELEHQAVSWAEGGNYLVVHEFQRASGDYVVWVEEVNAPSPEIFSIIVGDCLHNLSASLNFLAFELAVAHSGLLSDKAADEVEFPIFGDVDRQGQTGMGPRMFRKGAPKRIRSMAPNAQTEIEGLQPYKRGGTFTEDPLWRLYELARSNRHRFLHPAAAAFSGVLWNPAKISNATMDRPGVIRVHEGFIEGRTEVARFPVQPIDPSQEVYVDLNPSVGISFAQGTPIVAGKSMAEILSEIYNHVLTSVLPPLTPYLTRIQVLQVTQPYSLLSSRG